MTRFRHDLILRMIKLLDAVLVTIPFAMCWYLYYAKRVASPYYAKGDYLVVALFFVLFIIFGRVYDAFLMSMQRISEIIYEQFLAAAVSDFIMYIVIWLLSKQLPNILPGVAALVGQVIMASIWAYNAQHANFKTIPPQRVGERTLRQSEIFRAMAKFSPSGPAGPPLPFWRKRHLPRVGGVCLAEGGKETERNTL
uniref:hypothetical protein n=1 Tax=Gemmiger formicilis TaxID=745368 RepID=UPI0040279D2E